jgi:lysozyme family protein
MADIVALIRANETRWAKCAIAPARAHEVAEVAHRLVAADAKRQYLEIQQDTGVPWWVIAVIHEREASQSWRGSLAQGDRWDKVSRHVPRGRGPFTSFRAAACDALIKCAPYASRWKDWSAGGTLTLLGLYNGTGYEDYHHEASPYNWGATNQEAWGKYVSDGHWDASVWDTQIGCAALLKAMMAIDPSIVIGAPPRPKPAPAPEPDHVGAFGAIGAALIAAWQYASAAPWWVIALILVAGIAATYHFTRK